MNRNALAAAKTVDSKILLFRSQKVILDSDLAGLYGVSVKRLNQQVKRNARRFPADFVFSLSPAEHKNLRLQIATSSFGHGGRRYTPRAFTEHGAIMAATVLNSRRAVEMSIFVVRAFVRMREALAMNQQIMAKLVELERRLEGHDTDIQELVDAMRQLMTPPPANRRQIGFEVPTTTAKHRAGVLTLPRGPAQSAADTSGKKSLVPMRSGKSRAS
ncbi:MAG TPA: ORF6N domain-containing protein [Terriglobales bacterium]|nr:ORF6N domain-containing protein [Terriglobales bacterium]